MKIAIVTHAPFPEGLASTNRVFYHAKGLQANNIDVKVFIATPTERKGNIKNTQPKGSYKGVNYEYALNKSVRSNHFLQRRIDDFFGPIRTAFNVIRFKPDAAVIISHSSLSVLFALKVLFRMKGLTFIAERTEAPFHGSGSSKFYKSIGSILKRNIYKKLDGFLVISHELMKIYSKIISKNCPIVLIPVIVDVNDIYNGAVKRTRNLIYTGPLLQKKDGILTIIKSFADIAQDYPDTNLICTGNLESSRDKEKVVEEIEKSGVKDRIIMKGFVTRKEMIELLNSAVGLVLAKPSSDQADTCFPTKLGEYLATGNPIVVTKTGEIPLYLEDGVNAYIAEPDSVESFTDKLRDLLSDPIKAQEIGAKGKKTAEDKFNYAETAKKVIDLVEKINKGKGNNE